MHEYGLCDGVVEAIRARAGGRRVRSARVRVGALQRVIGEVFEHAFSHSAEGTEAEGAALDLVVVPGRATCGGCGWSFECWDMYAVCPHCGGYDFDVKGGDELTLESIAYDDATAGAA